MARQQNKKKATKPNASPPSGSTIPLPQPPLNITELEEFQKGYGDQWIEIVKHPAFQAAMAYLNGRKNKVIESLTDEQIRDHGTIILSDLRGHLNHEHDLATLHTQREQALPFEEVEEYFSPEQIAEIEQTKEAIRERMRRQRYAS